jgi:hypothetical protein
MTGTTWKKYRDGAIRGWETNQNIGHIEKWDTCYYRIFPTYDVSIERFLTLAAAKRALIKNAIMHIGPLGYSTSMP